ncbi:hypothetical protein LJC23_03390 [Desulfovibrio sp. OttesenSCG-928-I05]|nr:hypothetical protein [Desulfovibrio sp. OttesenSCG-928-I05]
MAAVQDGIRDSMREFFDAWNVDGNGVKPACEALFAHMASLPGLKLAFLYRQGISLSIRALPVENQEKIVALLDIIDDAPEERWVSLCFDASRVTDPEERGDLVPQGLQGVDACCFDYDADDSALLTYLIERLTEAAA